MYPNPAYRGGGRGKGHHNQHRQNYNQNRGHHQQRQCQNNWGGPSSYGGGEGDGFMIDRGGGSQYGRDGGHGGRNRDRSRNDYHGGGDRNRRDGRGHDRNQSRGGRNEQEVIDLDASDDDNVVADAASGRGNNDDRGRKRPRSPSSGRGQSGHQNKNKRGRSNSNDGRDSRHYDRHSGGRNRNEDDRRSRRDGDRQGWGNQNEQGGSGQVFNPYMAAAAAGTMPFMLDATPNPMNQNLFDQFQIQQQQQLNAMQQLQFQQMIQQQQQMGLMGMHPMGYPPPQPCIPGMELDGGRRQHDDRNPGPRNRRTRFDNDFQGQEQRRVQVSTNFPRKVFLEEVNLESDFAFRLDTSSNANQLNHRSIPPSHKSSYEGGVAKGIFGASKDEISTVYNKFHSFRTKLPEDVSASSEEDSDIDDSSKKKKEESLAKNFISISNETSSTKGTRGKGVDVSGDFDSYSFERKEGEMKVSEKQEYYNKEVRKQPQNISLWKEFVVFQDKVFDEADMVFDNDEGFGGRKSKKNKKRNRKALLEKKIAILDRALESNPNCLQLHILRMECLLDLDKPKDVLTEWKKLVLQHQQSAPYWMEYLLFSSSQLLIYSNTAITTIFDTCFQKFRLMMNPSYPEFQRPQKFLLFMSDITFGFSLLLKNAGYLETAVALHQAQLEFDFWNPDSVNICEGDIIDNWKQMCKAFEKFWKLETLRFGEKGAQGWKNYIESSPTEENTPVALSDLMISKFEEDAYDSLNQSIKQSAEGNGKQPLLDLKYDQRPTTWVCMESSRSKLFWLPWRASCSDADDCEDAHRIIPSSSITSYITPLPTEANFVTPVDRAAAHFRHIVNFLMTLREDFLVHTQCVDYVCSPFLSTTLNDSSSLFTEIYYWRKLIDLYVDVNNPENVSKFHHVFAPEGFKLADLTMPNVTSSAMLQPTVFNVTIEKQEDGDRNLDTRRLTLLAENNDKYMEMFYRILEFGLENLQPEFSTILFEMLLRFEHKLTCTDTGKTKQRVKFAKGLMKHEKLRNSVGGYRELAMLEYFGGKWDKAVELLIKTINASSTSLATDDWDQINWTENWNLILDLITLYRQLIELFLRNGTSDSKAYYTLIQLGNGFKSLESDDLSKMDEKKEENDNKDEWAPKTNHLLKATRSFEKVMDMLIPGSRNSSEDDTEVPIVVNNNVYYKWGGEHSVEYLLQQRNLIVEWTCCYALFQYFSKDLDAACKVYENVLKRLNSDQFSTRESYNPEIIRMHIREQLYINWCNLAARCLMKDSLMNSKFRNILSMALEEFPSSPPLLILFTDVENQTSVAGKLWRLMMNNMKPDSEKMVTHWAPLIMGIGLARKIEELEHDEEVGLPCFGLGGPAVPQDTIFYKLDSMISVAELHPGVRNCPLVWRVHLKMLALRSLEGKDVARAKKMFYDAIRCCPSSKALYLDGVNYFPELLQEVNDLMAEKELLIRLPLDELHVHLEIDDEETAACGDTKASDEQNNSGIEIEEIQTGKKSKRNKKKKTKKRESISDGEISDD